MDSYQYLTKYLEFQKKLESLPREKVNPFARNETSIHYNFPKIKSAPPTCYFSPTLQSELLENTNTMIVPKFKHVQVNENRRLPTQEGMNAPSNITN